jgi:hypothetical protein
MSGDSGSDRGGADVIHGGPGNDHLDDTACCGGARDDTLYGDRGNDLLDVRGGNGRDNLFGGPGEDRLEAVSSMGPLGNNAPDYLNGGAQVDVCHGDAIDTKVNCEK